jgi:large conductance mechanosensitive channel
MKMLKEFQEFAMRGNVVDLAVGIIIGGAFGKITTSLVNDVIMPPIGVITGGMDFSSLGITIKKAAVDAGGKALAPAVTISYGLFLNTLINFIIVAFAMFMIVKAMNTLKRKEAAPPPAPPAPPKQELLLAEIRDILKTKA